MFDDFSIKHFFPKIAKFCNAVTILLSVWLMMHLFIRSIGGPFPQRTMGPFPKKEYYQLGILPDWENLLVSKTPGGNETYSEMLNNGEKLPELQFNYPPEASAPAGNAASAAPGAPTQETNAAAQDSSATSATGN